MIAVNGSKPRTTFKVMSLPARALETCIIISLGKGMLGAIDQIVIHDIIPTFYSGKTTEEMTPETGSIRTWLVLLPFAGILIDITARWLKGYISPAFFWLHIPGGGIFGLIFVYVFLRTLWETWFKHEPS